MHFVRENFKREKTIIEMEKFYRRAKMERKFLQDKFFFIHFINETFLE